MIFVDDYHAHLFEIHMIRDSIGELGYNMATLPGIYLVTSGDEMSSFETLY